jgi:hypothetical protein
LAEISNLRGNNMQDRTAINRIKQSELDQLMKPVTVYQQALEFCEKNGYVIADNFYAPSATDSNIHSTLAKSVQGLIYSALKDNTDRENLREDIQKQLDKDIKIFKKADKQGYAVEDNRVVLKTGEKIKIGTTELAEHLLKNIYDRAAKLNKQLPPNKKIGAARGVVEIF